LCQAACRGLTNRTNIKRRKEIRTYEPDARGGGFHGQEMEIRYLMRIRIILVELKYQAILTTICSGRLRLGEAIHLRVSDIDGKRMTMLVRQGKGNKDRYTLLGERTLEFLRLYYKAYRPVEWLAPSKDPAQPLSSSSVQKEFKKALHKAGIRKNASVHTLRHCFATYLLESGTDLYHIQHLLGHTTVKTTSIYFHITGKDLAKVKSPIDLFPNDQKLNR
jgi:integrase/recombinase XerD